MKVRTRTLGWMYGEKYVLGVSRDSVLIKEWSSSLRTHGSETSVRDLLVFFDLPLDCLLHLYRFAA